MSFINPIFSIIEVHLPIKVQIFYSRQISTKCSLYGSDLSEVNFNLKNLSSQYCTCETIQIMKYSTNYSPIKLILIFYHILEREFMTNKM